MDLPGNGFWQIFEGFGRILSLMTPHNGHNYNGYGINEGLISCGNDAREAAVVGHFKKAVAAVCVLLRMHAGTIV